MNNTVSEMVDKGHDNASCILYDKPTKTIKICGGKASLNQIASTINNSSLLARESSRIWFLNANILVMNGATLFINSTDTDWLKVNSTGGTAYSIVSMGNLIIDNTKITSWNSTSNSETLLDSDETTPRAYLLVPSNGTGQLNITNSNISYLGYLVFDEFGDDVGFFTGIAYYAGDGSVINNNTISYNYRGFYAANVSDITFANNRVDNSYQYGYDPHTGAARMKIYNNIIYNSGSHGIICSKLCTEFLVYNNTSFNNTGHGIMLDQLVENSTVSANIAYDNKYSGIAIWNSSKNDVENNLIDNNTFGIIITRNSHDNEVKENIIRTSKEAGIFIYDNSTRNLFENNTVLNSDNSGIYIRDEQTANNRFFKNTVSQGSGSGFTFLNASGNILIDNDVYGNANYEYYLRNGSINNPIVDTIYRDTDITILDNSSNFISVNNENLITSASKLVPITVYDKNSTLAIYSAHRNIILDLLPMSAIPSSDFAGILIKSTFTNTTNQWRWTETVPVESISTKYVVGGFEPNKLFAVSVNGLIWTTVNSNSTGHITFTYERGGLHREFVVGEWTMIFWPPSLKTMAIIVMIPGGALILFVAIILKRRRKKHAERIID